MICYSNSVNNFSFYYWKNYVYFFIISGKGKLLKKSQQRINALDFMEFIPIFVPFFSHVHTLDAIHYNNTLVTLLKKFIYVNLHVTFRAGNRAGRVNNGLGQNRVGPKLTRFFWAKILVAQPALKIGLVRLNSLLKAKKIRMDRVEASHTGPGHIGPGQIWPDFFWANNLALIPDGPR